MLIQNEFKFSVSIFRTNCDNWGQWWPYSRAPGQRCRVQMSDQRNASKTGVCILVSDPCLKIVHKTVHLMHIFKLLVRIKYRGHWPNINFPNMYLWQNGWELSRESSPTNLCKCVWVELWPQPQQMSEKNWLE